MSVEETLLETRKFRVVRRALTQPDGRHRTLELIRHPGAAVILPILDDGRILLIRNQRPAVGATLLELPAGTLDAGEAPVDCARRELQEETGYTAETLTPLVSFFSTPGICDELMYTFVATGLTPGATNPDEGEEIEPVAMSLSEALAAAERGAIRDAKTLLSLMYYELFERRGAEDENR